LSQAFPPVHPGGFAFVVLVTGHADDDVKDAMTMMICDMTLPHRAGRPMSAAEQRRADEQLGRMAARVSRAWRRATRPARKPAAALGER
jgi:hypothetical protein